MEPFYDFGAIFDLGFDEVDLKLVDAELHLHCCFLFPPHCLGSLAGIMLFFLSGSRLASPVSV